MSGPQRQSEYQFDLSGGSLSLDFANTVSRRDSPDRRAEHLNSYADLLAFARQSESISREKATQLEAHAKHNPAEAARVLKQALALREAVFRTFRALTHHRKIRSEDVAWINQFALEAAKHRCLQPANGGFEWKWIADAKHPLEQVLWPIAGAAAELLTSAELAKIRECEAPDCEWLFLDASRNHSRRWCDMKSCGNRQKARRHYQRMHS